MRNSESFETIESQILESATLVAGNGEESDSFCGSAVGDSDFEDDGILIMPPHFEQKDDQEKSEGSAASLSLPESVPSTVGSFTVTNHQDANDEYKEITPNKVEEHSDKISPERIDEVPQVSRAFPSGDFVAMRSSQNWTMCLSAIALFVFSLFMVYTKRGAVIQSETSSFQVLYDEALWRIEYLEAQMLDLDKLQKENEQLRAKNVHLDNLVRSMRKIRRERDNLLTVNRHLEEKLESSDVLRQEQYVNVTKLANEVHSLSSEVVAYEARHNEANVKLEKAFQSMKTLSKERDRLLEKNRRLQRQLKKTKKQIDQDDKKCNAPFSWEGEAKNNHSTIGNCWLHLELGECSKEAQTSFYEGTQKLSDSLLKAQQRVTSFFTSQNAQSAKGSCENDKFKHTECLWNAQQRVQSRINDLKDILKESTISIFTSQSERDSSEKEKGDYYDKVQDHIFEYISNGVESMKNNHHVKSIGQTAKTIVTGVAITTAATVLLSSAFVGGLFGDDDKT